jgi:hypothetical protein
LKRRSRPGRWRRCRRGHADRGVPAARDDHAIPPSASGRRRRRTEIRSTYIGAR